MKNTLLLCIVLAVAGTQLQAQTNTFPSSGNVGIGTTSPSMPLTVKGPNTVADFQSTAASALLYFTPSGYHQWRIGAGDVNVNDFGIRDMTANVNRLSIDGNGNVGIGTTSQIDKLHIFGTGNSLALTVETGHVNNTWLRLKNDSSGGRNWSINSSGQNWPGGGGSFFIYDESGGGERMRISANGNVGIGTASPGYLLDVNGTIHAQGVLVDMSGADYVFSPSYKLMPLSQVEQAIKRDQHLPGIPSAKEMSSGGVSVGDLQAKLLAKVEELTLHQIEQEKQLQEQAQRIDQLEKENNELRTTR